LAHTIKLKHLSNHLHTTRTQRMETKVNTTSPAMSCRILHHKQISSHNNNTAPVSEVAVQHAARLVFEFLWALVVQREHEKGGVDVSQTLCIQRGPFELRTSICPGVARQTCTHELLWKTGCRVAVERARNCRYNHLIVRCVRTCECANRRFRIVKALDSARLVLRVRSCWYIVDDASECRLEVPGGHHGPVRSENVQLVEARAALDDNVTSTTARN
jgi:hypothetical protein